MCTEIQIRGGARLETLGDLWALVGKDNVVMSHEANFESDDCLCHVDARATAKKAGYDCAPGWDECCVDHVWFKNGQSEQK